MTWLISIFLSRIFAYLRKLAKKTDTTLDDKTIDILEPYIKAMLDGIYTPKDAAMNFMAAELQMLINHAQYHKGDTKIWDFLRGVQATISALDFEKKKNK